ncbi:MAG: hypothetical protein WBB45_21600 [Cyclobacteriaceae bacterium]
MSIKNGSSGDSLAGLVSKGNKIPYAFTGMLSDAEAYEKVSGLALPGSQPVVLISDITQLYDYVTRIPDLTWDLMEFAEKPLTLVLKGKNLPDGFLSSEGDMHISLIKEPVMLNYMKKYRKGFFYLPVDSNRLFSGDEGEILSPTQNVIILREEFLNASQAKTARLDMDGTIKFL